MKITKLLLIVGLTCVMVGATGQTTTLELTFTAVDSATHVRLDNILVMNRTQGNETRIYWPDTTLFIEINQGDMLLYVGYATFSPMGVSEVSIQNSSFDVYQNYPNPMGDMSDISMKIPQKGNVQLIITDLQGKVVLSTDRQLDGGQHSFRFYTGGGNFYFLTAQWNGISRSIKMISTGQRDGKSCRLEYIGGNASDVVLKSSSKVNDLIVLESGILDFPEENTSYTFQFATNIPCPGTPTVEYERHVYNTIQIFSQCWLKENLNVGTMINCFLTQTNNSIKEKYCYNNEPDSCAKYGGLYQWGEMMQYTAQQDAQGICPTGWHIPADEEWKVLEGATDSHFEIGDLEWEDIYNYRGYDAGTNLKTNNGWYENGNGTDLFCFSGLPGGRRDYDGGFLLAGIVGYWWTSSDYAWYRALHCNDPGVFRYETTFNFGYSVRCLKDY